MIYFDWKKILEANNGNVGDIITIMRIITFRITPKNYYDKTFKFYKYRFGGKSFLTNPKDLMEIGRSYSDKEVAEYAGVASFRNYHNYVNSKDTTLGLLECPISEDIIKANRLLEIKEGRIHFLFEETQGEK